MAELDRASISLRMGESREAAGLTQPEIAELLHVHMRTVQDWESPKMRTLPFDRMEEWARLTNVDREWLLYGAQVQSEEDRLRQIVQEELEGVREAVERIEGLLGEQPRARPKKAAGS